MPIASDERAGMPGPTGWSPATPEWLLGRFAQDLVVPGARAAPGAGVQPHLAQGINADSSLGRSSQHPYLAHFLEDSEGRWKMTSTCSRSSARGRRGDFKGRGGSGISGPLAGREPLSSRPRAASLGCHSL